MKDIGEEGSKCAKSEFKTIRCGGVKGELEVNPHALINPFLLIHPSLISQFPFVSSKTILLWVYQRREYSMGVVLWYDGLTGWGYIGTHTQAPDSTEVTIVSEVTQSLSLYSVLVYVPSQIWCHLIYNLNNQSQVRYLLPVTKFIHNYI